MEVFENLTPEVSGYQRAKRSGGRVAQEVKVEPRAGAESLYLWAEDLAESHVPEVQGCLVGDGCADPLRSCGDGGCRRAGQRVRYHVSCTWQILQLVGVFGDKSQVTLLAA